MAFVDMQQLFLSGEQILAHWPLVNLELLVTDVYWLHGSKELAVILVYIFLLLFFMFFFFFFFFFFFHFHALKYFIINISLEETRED